MDVAQHSYEKALWKRREVRKRMDVGGWWLSSRWVKSQPNAFQFDQQATFMATLVKLEASTKGSIRVVPHFYRKLWRRQAHRIEQVHGQYLHDEADDFDPQPRRLGLLWTKRPSVR
jgi:hypothetical protein